MTATDRRPETKDASVAAPPGAAAGQLRVRRQPKWIAVGLLAMCLGGLGAAALYAEASRSLDVLVVTRDVGRGEVIQQGDLRVARVGDLTGVSAVEATDLNALTGQRALIDLRENALLPSGGVGDAALEPGGSQLGLKLAPGRVPNADLPQGTTVLLVPLADPRLADTGESGNENTGPVRASVLTPPRTGPDGVAILLDVRVDSARAPEMAALAAVDRIALVKEAT